MTSSIKVLFVLRSGSRSHGCKKQYTRLLLHHLPVKSIGLATDDRSLLQEEYPQQVTTLHTNDPILPSAWDCCVVQDHRSLRFLKKKCGSTVPPVIWIAHSNDPEDQATAGEDIFSLVIASGMIVKKDLNVPEELATNIYIPAPAPSLDDWENLYHDGTVRLIWIPPEEDRSLRVSKEVVSAINQEPGMRLTIVCEKPVANILKMLGNDNIAYVSTPVPSLPVRSSPVGSSSAQPSSVRSSPVRSADTIILASQDKARDYLFRQYPTVIVGMRGLGGAVTGENLAQQLSTHFQGRAGGSLYEMIPAALLLEEIRCLVREKSTLFPALKDQLAQIRQHDDTSSMVRSFTRELERVIQLHHCLSGKAPATALKPTLPLNIRIDSLPDPDPSYIVSNHINRHLGVLGEEEYRLVSRCNGQNDLDTILENEESFEFIKELWAKKMIFFS